MLLLLAFACTEAPAVDSPWWYEPPVMPRVSLALSVSGVLDAALSHDASMIYFVDGSRLFQFDGQEVVDLAPATGVTGIGFAGDILYLANGRRLQEHRLTDGHRRALFGTETTGVSCLDLNPFPLMGGTEGEYGAIYLYDTGWIRQVVGGLSHPITGVVSRSDGTVYAAGGDTVYAIGRQGVTTLQSGLQLGDPTGIALTPDGGTLLVSTLSESGTAQILMIDVFDGRTWAFDGLIGANHASAGLHRAKDAPSEYVWVDREAGLYRLSF